MLGRDLLTEPFQPVVHVQRLPTASSPGNAVCWGAVACTAVAATVSAPRASQLASQAARRDCPHQSDCGQLFALVFLAPVPILVFCLALQKHFVKGLTRGATKG
ncbi:hypothetical protein AB0M29_41835 [Streptomyces sp. NPDC051976]|uniref:hypothetical protein n=1 Tax=Streptomyces sp. NPDC051976 TaxID=3154947 RepID=UPI00344298DC